MMRRKEKKESTYEKNWKKTSDKSVASFKWIKKEREKETHKREKRCSRALLQSFIFFAAFKVYKESHHHHHHVIISDDDVPLDECRSRDPGDVLFLHLFFFFFVFLLLLLDFIPECIIFSLRDSFFVLLLFLLENTSDEKEEEQLRRRYR
jgi:hypothetical protein